MIVGENFKQMWSRIGAVGRAVLTIGVLLIVVAVGWFGWSVMRPEYAVLFADLDPQDTAQIAGELDRMKVPYQIGAGDTSVLVEKSKVHGTRMKLMGKGVSLRGGVGFEIFNNTDFGMTEFAQKVNYQRALQGELARTIQSLDEVKSVRVHLVMPESGLFKKNGQKPKASITLVLKDGRSLQSEQVAGIQRLVAASVPDIAPDAVTVLDQRGVALTRQQSAQGEEVGASVQGGSKFDLEADLVRKAIAVLDKAFGPGRAMVSVDVTLTHEHSKITQEDVVPAGTRGNEATGVVVRRRTTSQESPAYTVPTAINGAEGGAVSRGSSTSEVEYQVGRRVEQTVLQPYVKRISVGVMLPRMLDKSRLDEIREVLSMSLGLNVQRGDQIAISAVEQFSPGTQYDANLAQTDAGGPGSAPSTAQTEKADGAQSNSADLHPVHPFHLTPEQFWLLVGSAFIAVILVVLALRGGRGSVRKMDEGDREQMLARVREWVRNDKALGEGGKG